MHNPGAVNEFLLAVLVLQDKHVLVLDAEQVRQE